MTKPRWQPFFLSGSAAHVSQEHLEVVKVGAICTHLSHEQSVSEPFPFQQAGGNTLFSAFTILVYHL